MVPTLFGILIVNFFLVQWAPGGPIEQVLCKINGSTSDIDMRLGGVSEDALFASSDSTSTYRGANGVDPKLIQELEKQFGFDKPIMTRFFNMVRNYLVFDLGNSYFKGASVKTLIAQKLPVSMSIGFWTTLLIYGISVPLGMKKARTDGSRFDIISSIIIILSYSIPSFLFALFLIILFAGGTFFQIFPLKGLVSPDFHTLSFLGKILDYMWHLVLPVLAIVMSGFAKLTLLTKNSFLEELKKNYVTTARSKGLTEYHILKQHVFRNAVLVIIAGFPSALLHLLFTSALLVEILFSLDGLGLLGFEAALNRDYPLMFGSLYVFTLIGLILHIIGDVMMMLVDRRIDLRVSRV